MPMKLNTVDEHEVFKSKYKHRLRRIFFNTLWNDKFSLAVVFVEGGVFKVYPVYNYCRTHTIVTILYLNVSTVMGV